MTTHRSNAQSNDKLRVILVKECADQCPAARAQGGDVSVTSLRVGDTVLQQDTRRIIVEIRTDFAGITGMHVIRGRRRRLAAALLVLDDRQVHYVDSDITKICPDCGRPVVRFT